LGFDPGVAIMRGRDVTLEDLRSPYQHHALLVGRAAAPDPAALELGDDQLHVRQAVADRTDPRFAPPRIHGGIAVHFGHAEALDDGDGNPPLHRLASSTGMGEPPQLSSLSEEMSQPSSGTFISAPQTVGTLPIMVGR